MEKIGIAFRDAKGEFRSFEEVINELSEKWATLDEESQRAVAKAMAGTYQRENFIALLNNLSQARELTAQALEDEGLATERYQIYLESTEAKIKQFQLALQEMYTTIINSDTINFVIDFGTSVVNLINDLGGLPKVMGMVIASLILFKRQSIAGDLTKVAMKVLDLSKGFNLLNKAMTTQGLFKGLKSSLNGITGSFSTLCSAITNYRKGIITAETATAMLTPAITSLTGVLGVLLIGFTAWSAHQKKLAQEAEENRQALLEEAKAYQETSKSLEDLKRSYGEITISTKSLTEKKAELRELQQQLIDTYGAEVAGIDLVNGSYDEQIKKLDELNERKRKASEIAFNSEYGNAKSELEDVTNDKSISYNYTQLGNRKNKAVIDEIVETMDKVSSIRDSEGLHLQFDVDNAEEYADVLGDVLLKLQANGMDGTKIYNNLNAQYVKLNESLENLSEAEKDLFQFNYETDMSDVVKKLGIEDLSSMTKEQLESVKDALEETFTMEDEDSGYKEYVMAMVDTLPILTDEVNKFTDAMDNIDVTKVSEEYKTLAETSKNIQTLIDSIDEAGGITQEVIDEIVTKYPELLSCINDESELRESLVQKIQETKDAQLEAINQLLMVDEEYYRQKIITNEEAYNTITAKLQEAYADMGMKYTGDLNNYINMEDAKAKTTEELINKLQQAWAEYFSRIGRQFGETSKAMETINKLTKPNFLTENVAKNNSLYQDVDSKRQEMFKQLHGIAVTAPPEIAEITSQLDKVKKIFEDYEPKDISIDIKDGSGSKSGKGSKGGSGSKGSKDKKTDYDDWLKDQIEQIEKHGKELDEQIELVEQKLSNAKDLGNSDLVKEYRQQLIDLHKEKKDNLVAEKEALQTLKAKLNGEEHIAEVQEKISDKILAWEKQKQELLEQEIGLIDDKWEHELNGIKQSQELLENTYTDVEADPKEALRVAREKVKFQKEELAIAKEKLAEYRNLGLMEDSEQVIELETEIAGLNGDLISDQLGVIELEFEASNVDIENLDEIKDLFSSAIDISEFIENYDEVIEAHNDIVALTKVQLNENRKVINGLKEKLSVTTDVYEKNKLQDQLNEALAKEQDLLADLIDQYQELADTQAELDAYGSQGRDAWEKENERQIKNLQKQKDALADENDELEKQNDLHEKELELEQLREKLENLKRNRNIQTIKQQEDGTWQWSYESDAKAIKETENDIVKLQKEMQESQDEIAKESQENMIDSEIERLEGLAEEKEEYYENQKEKYLDFYEEQVKNTNRGLDDVDRAMYSGLRDVDRTASDAMDDINDTMESGMEDLLDSVTEYVKRILAQMAQIGVKPYVPSTPEEVLKEATGRNTTTTKDIITSGATESSKTDIATGVGVITGIAGILGGLIGFDTGGYTGDWGNGNGKLALLHRKERVLSEEQTNSFDRLVDSITSSKTPKSISNLSNNSIGGTSVTIQNMTVQAEDNSSLDRFISNVLQQSRVKTSTVGV